jgi:hypothetical protein
MATLSRGGTSLRIRQPLVVHGEVGRQLNEEHAEKGPESSQTLDHPRYPFLRAEESEPVRQRTRRLHAEDEDVR